MAIINTSQTLIELITPPMAALLSPSSARDNDRDRFDLDRLAEELEQRELRSPNTASFPEHSLPAFVPLSHDNPHLSAEEFNVQEFLLSRSYTSLPDLRSELRDYLATLKEELVRLINDDYEAFISLSTDLRGEGARMERLQRPLAELRSQVLVRRVLHYTIHRNQSIHSTSGITT